MIKCKWLSFSKTKTSISQVNVLHAGDAHTHFQNPKAFSLELSERHKCLCIWLTEVFYCQIGLSSGPSRWLGVTLGHGLPRRLTSNEVLRLSEVLQDRAPSQASHVLHTLATTASIIPYYHLLVISFLSFLLFVISSGDSESGNWITLMVGQRVSPA